MQPLKRNAARDTYPNSTLPVELAWISAQASIFSKTTKSDFTVLFQIGFSFKDKETVTNNILQSARQEKDRSTLSFPVSKGYLFSLDLEIIKIYLMNLQNALPLSSEVPVREWCTERHFHVAAD